jgi:DNA repair photolyase
MELIEVQRRSRVLKAASFGCLQGGYTLNITRGCGFRCLYCYARGYPGAPEADEVLLYRNLPDKLQSELDSPRRRSRITWVALNTASDCFQPDPRILEVTYRVMEILLSRGVPLSFLTKGSIPPSFLSLFATYPELVTPRIGLVSLDTSYRRIFEPGTAEAEKRLATIERLQRIGLSPRVRIDPIIPFMTDDPATFHGLCEALAERGVGLVSASYLHLRPAVLSQLRNGLPPPRFELLQSCFLGQDWRSVGASSRSKLVPSTLRQRGYERLRSIATKYSISVLVCGCKNPDLSAQICGARPPDPPRSANQPAKGRQRSLFDI